MGTDIRKIDSKNVDLIIEFFQNCKTSDRYRPETFEGIIEQVKIDSTFYSVYANVSDGKVTSAVMMMPSIPIQKIQVLDLYFTRKGLNLEESKLGELVGHAIHLGETSGIYRVMSMVTEEYYRRLKVLEDSNRVFTWKKRYDCVVDEVLEPNHFSKYGIIFNAITKHALRKDRIFITHYLLKPEYRNEYHKTS